MKIKCDFVTNSSSSSFVAIGTRIDASEIVARGPRPEDNYDLAEDITNGTDLCYSFGPSYDFEDVIILGIEYTNMRDDETLAEFKQRVKDLIKERCGIDREVGHIEECWMDN